MIDEFRHVSQQILIFESPEILRMELHILIRIVVFIFQKIRFGLSCFVLHLKKVLY